MPIKQPIEQPPALIVQKRYSQLNYYGKRIYGAQYYGSDSPNAGIYQRRPSRYLRWNFYGKRIYGEDKYGSNIRNVRAYKKRKQQCVKMKFYKPTNPQSEPQQTNRAKLTAAVAAWQALDPEQKKVYNIRARKLHMYGYNLFLREHMLSH